MAYVPAILDIMKTLIIIPAYNEAAAIALLAQSIKAIGYDLLVIDDGSIDATADLAKKHGAQVIAAAQKSGKGNALRMGFDYALKHKYDAVIAMDGDGQHDPSDIDRFIQCHQKTKAQVINGNRMHAPRGMPWVRLATNAFMSWLISMVCRQPVPDTQCGFRFLTTDVLRNVHLESSDFEIETEMLIKASKKGFKIASVPIQTIYRNEVSKIQPFKDTLRFIAYIIREMRS